MKTKIIIKSDVQQSEFKKGMIGYIDGYTRGGNDVPVAAVVIGKKVDLVPLYQLEITN